MVKIQPLPADEGAVRRYVEELWLSYHHDLEAIVDNHALADNVDLISEEVTFRLNRLKEESYRAWVAVDETSDEVTKRDDSLTDGDGSFVGFITTNVDESPSVFERPSRLVIGDIYVREPYRGTGLANELIDHATDRARETECEELALDVDVENERAIAFYESLGFEIHRHRMRVAIDESDG